MKGTYALLTILIITLFSGCKQDFDITANYKEIPVVYGLLNQQDNKHYIRIQKGYLIDGNAVVAAGISDSIYYPDVLTVKLVPYSNSNNAQIGSVITLTRVDGNDPSVNLPKDDSIFANAPNWLYTFTGTLDPAKNYQLTVTNTSNNFSFKNVKDPDDQSPGIRLVKDFTVSTPSKGAKINLQNNNSSRVVWQSAENAYLYDLTVRFYYKEYASADNALLKDTFIDIPFFKSYAFDYTGGVVTPYEITSNVVLGYLASHLTANDAIYREFNITKGMQFKFAAGGKELNKFMNSRAAQGGLSSNEALPPYTNIDNGQGLLSSRYFKQVDSVMLSLGGMDSLACSDISRKLRFKNQNGQICQ
jgi:hypothetical protein